MKEVLYALLATKMLEDIKRAPTRKEKLAAIMGGLKAAGEILEGFKKIKKIEAWENLNDGDYKDYLIKEYILKKLERSKKMKAVLYTLLATKMLDDIERAPTRKEKLAAITGGLEAARGIERFEIDRKVEAWENLSGVDYKNYLIEELSTENHFIICKIKLDFKNDSCQLIGVAGCHFCLTEYPKAQLLRKDDIIYKVRLINNEGKHYDLTMTEPKDLSWSTLKKLVEEKIK